MCGSKHGQAVGVVLLSLLLAGPGVPGCSRTSGPAGEEAPESAARLPPPQTTREVVSRQALNVPADLSRIPPVARLPVGEQLMVYNAMGPLRLRVARPDGSSLAEVQVASGEVLVVDRRSGVKVSRRGGTEMVVAGPLEESAEYALFALPTGGVRQESERSLIRPETEAEREARAKAEKERQKQQEGAATQPSTRPGG